MKINKNQLTIFLILTAFCLATFSCQNAKAKNEINNEKPANDFHDKNLVETDTIIISVKHNPNTIFCDMDGDNLSDTIKIVQNTRNNKYGLKIIFGNKKVAYLGMGEDVLGQGFDDFDGIGIFEKAPKGEIYFSNVNEDGEIIGEEEVKEEDKIKLPNDGIYIHELESCGGGVIYLKQGKFEWIQQE